MKHNDRSSTDAPHSENRTGIPSNVHTGHAMVLVAIYLNGAANIDVSGYVTGAIAIIGMLYYILSFLPSMGELRSFAAEVRRV